MQSVLGRAMPVFALVFASAALFSASASAGVHHEIDYCGDQYGDCDPANNNDFFGQLSIMVEHSATATGEYVWVGQTAVETGKVTANAPLNNPGAAEAEIDPYYSDYSQELYPQIRGLAYDPDDNVIFISDSSANRVLAFVRPLHACAVALQRRDGREVRGRR
jgi:hypothetical protein